MENKHIPPSPSHYPPSNRDYICGQSALNLDPQILKPYPRRRKEEGRGKREWVGGKQNMYILDIYRDLLTSKRQTSILTLRPSNKMHAAALSSVVLFCW